MATQYRYLFADLISNDILAELPLTNVQFSQVQALGLTLEEIAALS